MVERQRGEKSYVRIARSSKEQNGYERHRTRPVPVSILQPVTALGTPLTVARGKIKKPVFGFWGSAEKFSTPVRSKVNRKPKSMRWPNEGSPLPLLSRFSDAGMVGLSRARV